MVGVAGRVVRPCRVDRRGEKRKRRDRSCAATEVRVGVVALAIAPSSSPSLRAHAATATREIGQVVTFVCLDRVHGQLKAIHLHLVQEAF